MLVQTIIRYLAAHKRLVVPQLGAFIVKTPGESVVFSELLRQDDGVLRGLLADGGMSPLEAAGAVDRFVFEVRHAVQEGREYVLEGFGVLRPGPNGTIAFVYKPQAAAEAELPKTAAVPVSGAQPKTEEAERTGGMKLTPSPKMNPEPYVRGLRYGKPEKTTNAYTYINKKPRRRGFDKLLLLAIAAAVIALAAITYGYIREARTQNDEAAAGQLLPAAVEAAGDGPDGQTTTGQK